MPNPAVEDFDTIRKRIEEIREEKEGAQNGVDINPSQPPSPEPPPTWDPGYYG